MTVIIYHEPVYFQFGQCLVLGVLLAKLTSNCASNYHINIINVEIGVTLGRSVYVYLLSGNLTKFVNPRRACAARVTVLGLCVWCVCLLLNISLFT